MWKGSWGVLATVLELLYCGEKGGGNSGGVVASCCGPPGSDRCVGRGVAMVGCRKLPKGGGCGAEVGRKMLSRVLREWRRCVRGEMQSCVYVGRQV